MDVLESGACTDEWLQDQLVIFMALAKVGLCSSAAGLRRRLQLQPRRQQQQRLRALLPLLVVLLARLQLQRRQRRLHHKAAASAIWGWPPLSPPGLCRRRILGYHRSPPPCPLLPPPQGRSRLLTAEPTLHTRTACMVAEALTGARCRVARQQHQAGGGGTGRWLIEVYGAAVPAPAPA